MKEVTELLASGRNYLLHGENDKACESLSEAAKHLLIVAASQKGREKATTQLNAATAYMEGGCPGEARNILNMIDVSTLNERWRSIFHKRVSTTTNRVMGRYVSIRRAEIETASMEGDWQKVVDLLSEDPYVYASSKVARLREKACMHMNLEDSAKEFAKDADRLEKSGR